EEVAAHRPRGAGWPAIKETRDGAVWPPHEPHPNTDWLIKSPRSLIDESRQRVTNQRPEGQEILGPPDAGRHDRESGIDGGARDRHVPPRWPLARRHRRPGPSGQPVGG